MARIADYRIVISDTARDNEKRAARFLQNSIRLVTGTLVGIVTDKEAPSPLEIVIGNTGREPSGFIPERSRRGLYEYVIKNDGARVFISGLGVPDTPPAIYNTAYRYVDDGATGTLMGVYRFTEEVLGYNFIYDGYSYLPDTPDLEMPLPCEFAYTRESLKTRNVPKFDGTALYMLSMSEDLEWNLMSFVLKTGSGKLVVIDGGQKFELENLLGVLRELTPDGKVPEVEAWFLTHLHGDHYGAFVELVQNYGKYSDKVKVKNYYCHLLEDKFYLELSKEANAAFKTPLDAIHSSPEVLGCNLVTLEAGEDLVIDELTFHVVHVPDIARAADMNMNDSSMVMRLDTCGQRILFLSDAEWVCNNDLLENHRDEIKSDVVQVGHHGCGNVSRECYEAIGAKYYLWQLGNRFWYGEKGEGIGTHNTGVIRMRNWIRSFGIPEKNIILDKDRPRAFELPINY